jgi:hypothetical protein
MDEVNFSTSLIARLVLVYGDDQVKSRNGGTLVHLTCVKELLSVLASHKSKLQDVDTIDIVRKAECHRIGSSASYTRRRHLS